VAVAHPNKRNFARRTLQPNKHVKLTAHESPNSAAAPDWSLNQDPAIFGAASTPTAGAPQGYASQTSHSNAPLLVGHDSLTFVEEQDFSCQTDFEGPIQDDDDEVEARHCSSQTSFPSLSPVPSASDMYHEPDIGPSAFSSLSSPVAVAAEDFKFQAMWPPAGAEQPTMSWVIVPLLFAVANLTHPSIEQFQHRWGPDWSRLVQLYRLSMTDDDISLITLHHRTHMYVDASIQERLIDRPGREYAGHGLHLVAHLSREPHLQARRLHNIHSCSCWLCTAI
jgi:hypothetical protein